MALNERRRRFAEYYAATANATEAARAAGYSEKTARSQGQRLLTNADVLQYVRQLQSDLAAERIADVKEIRERMTEILRSRSERTGDRLKAADTLLKSAGAYVQGAKGEKDPEYATPGEDAGFAKIALPWNGQQVITAIMRENGELVPLLDVGTDTEIFITEDTARNMLDCHFQAKDEHFQDD